MPEIQKMVFKKRPVLKEILEKYSNLPLQKYVQSWQVGRQAPDKLFLEILRNKTAEIYTANLAESVYNQLLGKPLLSTISHLGIWNHPIFVNSDLIFSLHFKAHEIVPVLATESVSLNNTSSWSASLLLHKQDGNLERYSFLPGQLKNLPVFSSPTISQKDIQRFQAFTQGRLDDVVGTLDLESTRSPANFSTQACRASFNLWQKVFPSAPKLIYLPLETIVSDYLLKILVDDGHPIARIIMTNQGRQLWQKYFSNEHSVMFWGIGHQGRRIVVKNLPDNVHEIISFLKNRKFYPSSPLCFLVLLICGFSCVGGFTQTTWLTEVKTKLVNLFNEMKVDSASINSLPTKNFAESSLAWLKVGSKYVTPTAVDLFKTNKDYYPKYLELANKITLGQSLQLITPTIYNVVVPKQEHLAGFDEGKLESEIFRHLGLESFLNK